MVLLCEMCYTFSASWEAAGHPLVIKITNQFSYFLFTDTRKNVSHSSVTVIQKLICGGRQSQTKKKTSPHKKNSVSKVNKKYMLKADFPSLWKPVFLF